MKPELEQCLDALDKAIHDKMIDAAMAFNDMNMEDYIEIMESTGGVVTVLQSRHMHAIVAFLGAMLDMDISTNLVREQAGRFKESFSEMVDDAVTMAICQHTLNNWDGKVQ